jgi:uncharacterized cupin superfamily protein
MAFHRFAIAVMATGIAPQPRVRDLPEPFGNRLAGRERRVLGDLFGLSSFGVNYSRLEPGGMSSFRHFHSKQDEFIYIVQGSAILVTEAGEITVSAGMCAGFPAGRANAHHLVNRSDADVYYLEIGDRSAGDVVTYPDDDLHAELQADGHYRYCRKDGSPIV